MLDFDLFPVYTQLTTKCYESSNPPMGARAGAPIIRLTLYTFTDAIFIPIIVLILVEVAEESRSALDAVHPGDSAVAVLTPSGGADLAAAAVIQHRPPAAQRRAAQPRVAFVRAVYGVFTPGTPRLGLPENHHQHEHWDGEHTHGWKRPVGCGLRVYSAVEDRSCPLLGCDSE